MKPPRRLFHYTCDDHGYPGIIREHGFIRPNPYPGLQKLVPFAIALPVVWLTDLDVVSDADRQAVGLVGVHTLCNRTAYRFMVRAPDAQWWPDYADAHAHEFPAGWRDLVELGCQPHRWWVSTKALTGALLDDAYRRRHEH